MQAVLTEVDVDRVVAGEAVQDHVALRERIGREGGGGSAVVVRITARGRVGVASVGDRRFAGRAGIRPSTRRAREEQTE